MHDVKHIQTVSSVVKWLEYNTKHPNSRGLFNQKKLSCSFTITEKLRALCMIGQNPVSWHGSMNDARLRTFYLKHPCGRSTSYSTVKARVQFNSISPKSKGQDQEERSLGIVQKKRASSCVRMSRGRFKVEGHKIHHRSVETVTKRKAEEGTSTGQLKVCRNWLWCKENTEDTNTALEDVTIWLPELMDLLESPPETAFNGPPEAIDTGREQNAVVFLFGELVEAEQLSYRTYPVVYSKRR